MDRDDVRRALAARFDTAQTHYARWQARGGYLLERSPLPEPLPERVALYLIAPGGNTTRVGVVDLDAHDGTATRTAVESAAVPVVDHLRRLGHHPLTFRSSGGEGIHV